MTMTSEKLKRILDTREVYSFGTSGMYDRYKDYLSQFNFKGFFDNDNNKKNKHINGYFVYDPTSFEYNDDMYIVIMSSYSESITTQLESYGLKHYENFCTCYDLEFFFDLNIQIPHGHFYSPVPNLKEIFAEDYKSYPKSEQPRGINLNTENQLNFFEKNIVTTKVAFNKYLEKDNLVFYLNNSYFEYVDSWVYFSMINFFKPSKIIEVGSGFTSALAIETVDELKLDTEFVFVEPYPFRLIETMNRYEKKFTLIKDVVQSVKVEQLTDLNENDILFIDSSHISKYDSDVNYLFFEVFPNLKKGTIIHLHDIFSNFEYPKDWLYRSRYWNENYLLRAFLQYNDSFEILFFNDYMQKYIHENKLNFDISQMLSGSIWLKKIK